MTGPQPQVLLCSPVDFGWGSVGKLRLILDELAGVDVVLDPDSSASEEAFRLLSQRHQLNQRDVDEAAVALVINDPAAADRLTGAGLPVVYVDSLPYLWATDDEVPQAVSVYCAQSWPGQELPKHGPLANRRDIDWIDPIVPRARRRRGGAGIVINVGGLHSHVADSAVDAYLQLAVLPLIAMFTESGAHIAAVCGNLPGWACQELTAKLPPDSLVGAQNPYEFEATLRTADLLVTSPGSTTILQAAAIRLPTMLLPPQNLSQILNAEIFGDGGEGVVSWPKSVLDRTTVDELRPQGEKAALDHIYAAIAKAGDSPQARSDTTAALHSAYRQLPADGALARDGKLSGDGSGAQQVARRIRQALLAPFPHPRSA